MNEIKSTKGITLVALVVTIIVLIILAGISINLILGENGIITKAKETKEIQGIADYKEKIELLKADLLIENQGEFTIKELKQKILDTNTVPGGSIELSTDGISADVTTKEGYQFVITAMPSKIPGLYDANDVMLASWEELESYGFDINKEVDLESVEIPDTILSSVLNGEHAEKLKNATKLIIPDNVTSIGDAAFYNCNNLTNIEIPDGVTSIGDAAFYNCNNLTNIEIPDGVTSIGYGAFFNCNNLTNIEIPDGVTSIGDAAFYYCNNLINIEIPDGVTSIGEATFAYCGSLMSISVSENNSVYDSRENCNAIIETNTNILIKGSNNTIIPDGITSISEYAFNGCTNLTNIEIPDSVTAIYQFAFEDCTGLTSIEIPENLEIIEDYAFGYCTSLTSIKLPDTMTRIGESAFSGCTSLTKINYKGTKEQWQTINFGPDWKDDCPATIVYNYTE